MGGGSLEDELDRGEDNPLPINEATKWMKDICEGLDNARRHGIIHHDIKPGNFMLDEDKNVKIGDFGISQALHDSNAEEVHDLTKDWGSPDYVSPEKVSTGKETYLGDIYSLGASFYHLLTGELPFDNSDTAELLKVKTLRDPIDIIKLREDIPETLAELIMKMMDRTPEVRPSYRDIVAELNSMSKSKVKKKKGANLPQKKAPVATNASMNVQKPKAKDLDPAKYGIKKKNPILSLIMVVVFLGLLCAGGYYLWSEGFLGEYISGTLSDGAADKLPGVTKLLSQGKSVEAASLAELTFASPLAEKGELKQAALQLAICNYLNNEPEVDNKCSVLADRLIASGIDQNSPEVAILRYLSVPDVTGAGLRSKLVNESGLRMVGEVAAYVKETYYKGNDKDKRSALRQYSSLSSDVNSAHWAFGWGDRIQKWYDWSFSGKGDESTLEPLIRKAKLSVVFMPEDGEDSNNSNTTPDEIPEVAPTTSLTIEDLTEEWLDNNRAFAENRPKPENFVFTDSNLESYLSTLPDEVKQREIQRSNILKPMKIAICKMMLRKPYKGRSLVTKTGKRIGGTVMGSPKGLRIRTSDGKAKIISWDQLHIDQFIKLLAYYAKAEEASSYK